MEATFQELPGASYLLNSEASIMTCGYLRCHEPRVSVIYMFEKRCRFFGLPYVDEITSTRAQNKAIFRSKCPCYLKTSLGMGFLPQDRIYPSRLDLKYTVVWVFIQFCLNVR